jgi:hypothetical protein
LRKECNRAHWDRTKLSQNRHLLRSRSAPQAGRQIGASLSCQCDHPLVQQHWRAFRDSELQAPWRCKTPKARRLTDCVILARIRRVFDHCR